MSDPKPKPRPAWPAVVTAGVVGGAAILLIQKLLPMALASLTALRDHVKARLDADKAASDAKDAKIADLEAKLADATDTADDEAVVAEIEGLLGNGNPTVPTDTPADPATGEATTQ